MAKNVIIERSGSKLVKAWVNQTEVTFDANDKAKVQVDSGVHPLVWLVLGAPGDKYKVSITAPNESKFEHSATLDSDLKDGGIQWFKVDA